MQLINMVGDYLFQTKIDAETAQVQQLAVDFSPTFARADTDSLYMDLLSMSRELGGRFFIVDMDGKVQMDTYLEYNGMRVAHPEILAVLHGAQSDYGFHLQQTDAPRNQVAFFDFLRDPDPGENWVGYFAEALSYGNETVGVLLFSVSVQEMVDSLRAIQDRMLQIFVLAMAAVLMMSILFTRIITKPIGALTAGIQRMARGDLSGRVKVSGVDEMGRLAETFNQMSEKLENLDTSRNEFVSNASHELKTPLATMKIMLESMLYQDDMDPALRHEFLGDMNKELDRLSGIVTDLLTLVQSDAHEYKLRRNNIMLRDLAQDTLRRLEPLARDKGQTLTFEATTGVPVFADPMKLQQVIYNLVDNAIKYTPKLGEIAVSVRQEGRLAVLEVSDNGPGIPKKDQTHIFDRFYRVDRARSRATGGNGLGLSIVYQAVMMHDGSISVQSEEGKGSTFRVELPLAT